MTVHRVGLPLSRGRQMWSLPAVPLSLRLASGSDLVHAHQGEDMATLAIGAAAARRGRVPLVVTLHTSICHTLEVADVRTAVVRGLGGPLEAAVVRAAAAVIVLTDRMASRLERAGVEPRRIHVIPSGVDAQMFNGPFADPLPGVPRPRIAFVGRLAPQKAPLDLVEALARMRVQAHAVVVGDGPQRTQVQNRIARLGLDRRVSMTGFVSRAEVAAHLAHCDVLALPSRYEELGTAVLEAMASGLPVVASGTGGITEIVQDGHTGLLTPAGDPGSLAAALDRVLMDPAWAAALGRAGHARSRAFRWDELAGRVLSVYESAARAVAEPRVGWPVLEAASETP